jgi:peptidoglycan biosynthesis protein MviN/MurJ (putative lipid II flippase)
VRHSTYVPWREWLVLALLLAAAGLVLWWAADLRTPWFRWLVFAVTVPPTAIVLLVAAWVFPLLVLLLVLGWVVRQWRSRGRG